MRRSWAAVTVGMLAVVVLGGAYGIFSYTSESTARDGYTLHAFFSDALGLHDKTAVRSAGIDIGRIDSKSFDYGTGLAKIVVRFDKGIVIYENAVLSKRSASLLGEFYLALDPGTEYEVRQGVRRQNRALTQGERIRNVSEATNVGQILDQVNMTLPTLQKILLQVESHHLGAHQADRRQRQHHGGTERGGAGTAAPADGQHRRGHRIGDQQRDRRCAGGPAQRAGDQRGVEEPGG